MNQKPSPINIVPDATTRSTAIPDDAHRCHYRTTTGRRCRQPLVSSRASLCARHQRLDTERHGTDLAATLMGDHQNFATLEGIGASLNELYLLLARNRISARRAAILAFISNSLVRVVQLLEAKEVQSPPRVVFGLPRPDRSDTESKTAAEAARAYERIRT